MSEGSRNSNVMVIPAFKTLSELRIDMSIITDRESRLPEAKTVSPLNYSELEYSFAEGWRDARRQMTNVTYQITLAETLFEEVKGELLIDKYPEYKESKGILKSQDSADMRNAFLSSDTTYKEAKDRINQLKALEAFLDTKMRMFEKISQSMKKQMDLIMRSGMSNKDLYITSGNKGK